MKSAKKRQNNLQALFETLNEALRGCTNAQENLRQGPKPNLLFANYCNQYGEIKKRIYLHRFDARWYLACACQVHFSYCCSIDFRWKQVLAHLQTQAWRVRLIPGETLTQKEGKEVHHPPKEY